MRIYLASPRTQQQADAARDMPVLISHSTYSPWQDQYIPSFDRLLLDSGAFSELNSGVKIDLVKYIDWAQQYDWADAYAGLDDIRGDWKRSLENYKAGGFPTIHDSDPKELLDDLICLARERGHWIGIGLVPPRNAKGKELWLKDTLDRIPDDLHVHGWACGSYTHLPRLDSVDSTHWWREAMRLRVHPVALDWLTYGETLEIIVKKIQRFQRMPHVDKQFPLLTDSLERAQKEEQGE